MILYYSSGICAAAPRRRWSVLKDQRRAPNFVSSALLHLVNVSRPSDRSNRMYGLLKICTELLERHQSRCSSTANSPARNAVGCLFPPVVEASISDRSSRTKALARPKLQPSLALPITSSASPTSLSVPRHSSTLVFFTALPAPLLLSPPSSPAIPNTDHPSLLRSLRTRSVRYVSHWQL